MKNILRNLVIGYFKWIPWKRPKGRLFEFATRHSLLKKPFVFKVHGIRMNLDVSDFLQQHIFIHGVYEKQETEVWIKLCRNARVIFDVGANIGYYSLLAAANTQGMIYSFEPVSETFNALKKNAELNGFDKINLSKYVISDKPGTVKIYKAEPENTGMSSVLPGKGISNEFEEVPALTLDDFIKSKNINEVSLIKVDVEGSELSVLRGMKTVLQNFRPVVMMEVLEETLKKFNAGVKDVYSIFEGLGYRAYDITRDYKLKLITVPKEKIGLIVFAHKEDSNIENLKN